MTVAEALQLAAGRLRSKGLPSPREDSEWLVAWAVEADRVYVYTHPEAALSAKARERLECGLRRREQFFPLQYLRGEQEFFGRSFHIDASTLIPRPETELLVEVSLEVLSARSETSLRAIDLGTGSGCIAVTLACEEPRLRVMAIDISPAALAVARNNARRWACQKRLQFVVGDVLGSVTPRRAAFDLIVSNPPYVAWEKRDEVDVSVRQYEPRAAVFAEDGGLAVYKRLLLEALPLLKPGGRLALELGYDLHRAVSSLAAGMGWVERRIERDLSGHVRCALYGRAEESAH